MSWKSLWQARDKRGLTYKAGALASKWAVVATVGLGFITTEIGDRVTEGHLKGRTPEQAARDELEAAGLPCTPDMVAGCAFEKRRSMESSARGHVIARKGSAGVLLVLLPVWAAAAAGARRRERLLEIPPEEPGTSPGPEGDHDEPVMGVPV